MRARPGLVLGAIVVLAALLLFSQTRRVESWVSDEEYFIQLARVLAEGFPSSIWNLPVAEFDDRGFQRLQILLLAAVFELFPGETGWVVVRALLALAFASTAIPAYRLARGVALSTGWSLVAAVLAISVPWALLTGSILTESVAYATAGWATYGAWRACVVPGWRSDVLALVLAVMAGLARTNLIVLAGMAPVAVAVVSLTSARAAGRDRWLSRARGTVLRDHPVLAAVLVLGAVAFALSALGVRPGPLADLAGGYVTTLSIDWAAFSDKLEFQLATIALGVGFVPALLALPWALSRPFVTARASEVALAAVAVTSAALLLLSTLYAAPEERYIIYLVPALVVAGVVALAHRAAPAWLTAAWGGLLVWLIARQDWIDAASPADLLLFPERTFTARVIFNQVRDRFGGDPLVGLCVLLVLVTVGATVLMARRRSSARAGAGAVLVAGALVAVQIAQTQWTVRTYARATDGAGPFAERTWVDARVPGRQPVGMLAAGVGNTSTYSPIWRDVMFWNRQPDLLLPVDPLGIPYIPRYGAAPAMRIDPRTGALTRSDGRPVPRWMLEPTLFSDIGLAGRIVKRSAYLPVQLLHLEGTPRATHRWRGQEVDGWLSPTAPTATATVFPTARGRGATGRCLRFSLVAPGFATRPHRYVVRAGDRRTTGAVSPGGSDEVRLRLGDATSAVRVTATGASATDPDGRRVSLQISSVTAGRCG